MNRQWLLKTESEEKIVSHNDLVQQIQSGAISIQDLVKTQDEKQWSQIYKHKEIIDTLDIEYIKNDCYYGPVTGKELGDYYQASKIKKNTAVRVVGQELWHHYSLICHVRKNEEQKQAPIFIPVTPDAQPVAIKKRWTSSDVMILSLSALSLAFFIACYFAHHP